MESGDPVPCVPLSRRTTLGEEAAVPSKKVKEISETSTGMKSELTATTDRKRAAMDNELTSVAKGGPTTGKEKQTDLSATEAAKSDLTRKTKRFYLDRSRVFVQELDEKEMEALASGLKEARKRFASLHIFDDQEEKDHLREIAIPKMISNYMKNPAYCGRNGVKRIDLTPVQRPEYLGPKFRLENLTNDEYIDMAKYAINQHNLAVEGNIDLIKELCWEDEGNFEADLLVEDNIEYKPFDIADCKLVFEGLLYAKKQYLHGGFYYSLVFGVTKVSNNALDAYEAEVMRYNAVRGDGKLENTPLCRKTLHLFKRKRKGTSTEEAMPMSTEKIDKKDEISTEMKAALMTTQDRKRTAPAEEAAVPTKKVKEISETSTGMKSELATTTDRS